MAEKGGHWVKSAGGGMSFVAAGGGASGGAFSFKTGDRVEITSGSARGRSAEVVWSRMKGSPPKPMYLVDLPNPYYVKGREGGGGAENGRWFSANQLRATKRPK
jgi:hypothetical protein